MLKTNINLLFCAKIIAFVGVYFLNSLQHLQAQKTKPTFTSINSFGLITGPNQTVFTMQTFNGFTTKSWVHGIGFSIDNYGSRSSPIFLGTRKFLSKANKMFVYADAGVNIPWITQDFPKKWSNGTDAYSLKIKPYAEIGLGIMQPLNKTTKFVVTVGYSEKHFGYTESNNWWGWGPPNPTGVTVKDYDYIYRRISLKFGIVF